MLDILPFILFYSLISCILTGLTGLLLGWLSFKFNFTVGMILSGVLGFTLAVMLVFGSFKMSSAEKAWVVLLPLMITGLVFTITHTTLFFFFFKYQLGQVIENAKPIGIKNATGEQLFFKLSAEADFDTDQTMLHYGRNKSVMFICPLIDKKSPETKSQVWFARSYTILSPEEESKADFIARVKKLKADFEFFTPDFIVENNFNPPISKEIDKNPVFLTGMAPPKVKFREMSRYLVWSIALQNIIFIVFSLALSQVVSIFIKNVNH